VDKNNEKQGLKAESVALHFYNGTWYRYSFFVPPPPPGLAPSRARAAHQGETVLEYDEREVNHDDKVEPSLLLAFQGKKSNSIP
jgi:hypothetical protein